MGENDVFDLTLFLEAHANQVADVDSDLRHDRDIAQDALHKFASNFHEDLRGEFYDTYGGLADVLKGFREIYVSNASNAYQYTQSLLYRNHLLKILEVLQMPIANPHTGEMDYVDFSIIERTIMEPTFIYCFKDLCLKKVDFTLSDNDETTILLNAKFPEASEKFIMTKDQFEEIMSRIIHVEKDKRIEQTPEFQNAISQLINEYTNQRRVNKEFYMPIGNHLFNNGIGIIHDLKAEEDIGTFERVEVNIESGRRDNEYVIHDIFLSVRTEKELSEQDGRFEYRFYNLDHNLLYVFKPKGAAKSECRADFADVTLVLDMESVQLEDVPQDERLDKIKEAQNTKGVLDNIKEDNPMYSERFEDFRDARMSIVRMSREKAEKNKVARMFFDIEL